MTSDTFSAKQVATRIGTDPKTLRKFLRSAASPYEAVGQGSRYEFPKNDLREIKRAFLKWQKGKPPPAPAQELKITDPAAAIMISRSKSGVGLHRFCPSTKLHHCLSCGKDEDHPVHFTEDELSEEPTQEELDAIERGEI